MGVVGRLTRNGVLSLRLVETEDDEDELVGFGVQVDVTVGAVGFGVLVPVGVVLMVSEDITVAVESEVITGTVMSFSEPLRCTDNMTTINKSNVRPRTGNSHFMPDAFRSVDLRLGLLAELLGEMV